MYAVCLRPETQGPATAKEPIGMRQSVSHHAARGSFGASKESLRRAEAGNLTLLKRVIEKSRGEAPLRRGKRIEMIPGNGSRVLQMGTMNGRIPLSSPLMIRRAITRATLLTPNVGLEAGINLRVERVNINVTVEFTVSTYLVASSCGVWRT
jgi:hypothetical protein